MQTWVTSNDSERCSLARGARGAVVMLLSATLYGLSGAGSVTAQTTYDNLDYGLSELTARLMSGNTLAGKRVLVTPHDFFEEGTRRNLPLSATLRERFSAELSTRGVEVPLPGADEREVVVLQGIWRILPGPGGKAGTKTLHLTVKLIESGEHAHPRVIQSAKGNIKEVSEELLAPDLASWGRYAVKALESGVGDSRRRAVHIGDVTILSIKGEDVAGSKLVQRYLERRWLRPALVRNRLFKLVAAPAGGRQSDGVLHVDAFVGSEHVEIALIIEDNEGGQVTSATVELAKELFPAGMFPPAVEDRQRIMLRKDLGVISAKELDGATVCIRIGADTHRNLADYFRRNRMNFEQIPVETYEEALQHYAAGRCDLLTAIGSALDAMRSTLADPNSHVILPETIDK